MEAKVNLWTAKDETIDWFASTSTPRRLTFVKSLLEMLNEDELRTVRNYVAKARHHEKKKQYEVVPNRILKSHHNPKAIGGSALQGFVQQRSVPQGSVPQGSVPQGSVPQGSVPQGSAPQGSAPRKSLPQGSVPQGSVQQVSRQKTPASKPDYEQQADESCLTLRSPQVNEKESLSEVFTSKGWWKRFHPSQVLALDCEHVALKEVKGERRIQCAEVSIVDSNFEVVYSSKFYWPVGSFLINKHTKEINGFNENSLVNGSPFELVREKFKSLFKDKLVITCGGTNDLTGLDLDWNDFEEFERFDLHQHFQKPAVNQYGISDDDNLQPIGLRSLYHYFFKEDIHVGVHTAEADAKATMKLFMEVYVKTEKTEDLESKFNNNPHLYSKIPTIKS
ncbi:unnamed protein product [Allacma fusca]|uniref:Exonuclease domain-containing protein n=1 Tax=Allacma fusca TaxID=39272 RepID=A0A8J2KSU7_9HEXA|nr:unnamed protein product [Allacma fusca]